MARKRRMMNTVRTDRFESDIAHYRTLRDYSAAGAIERLARSVGAPIDQDKINKEVERRRAFYRHLEHGGSALDDIGECAVCAG